MTAEGRAGMTKEGEYKKSPFEDLSYYLKDGYFA